MVRGAVRRIGCGLFLALCLAQFGLMTEVRGQNSSGSIRPFGDQIPAAAIAGFYVGLLKQNENGHQVRNYLRFYADGSVVSVVVNTAASAEEAANFLHKGSPAPTLTGRFQFTAGQLDFTTADEVVSIHYHGEVRGDTLVLSWKSSSRNATGNEEVYRFLPGL